MCDEGSDAIVWINVIARYKGVFVLTTSSVALGRMCREPIDTSAGAPVLGISKNNYNEPVPMS